MTVLALADLQDQLLTVTNDLARLRLLLDEACTMLLDRFQAASTAVTGLGPATAREQALAQIDAAVVGLQFQDMASQLIVHASHRLAYCTDRLANEAFGSDDDGAAVVQAPPSRPNPVSQADMVSGTVDLF